MFTILKYLKARYIDTHLDERAQGMVEYALLIAGVICLAAYLIYGDNHGQKVEQIFEDTGDTLEAANESTNARKGDD